MSTVTIHVNCHEIMITQRLTVRRVRWVCVNASLAGAARGGTEYVSKISYVPCTLDRTIHTASELTPAARGSRSLTTHPQT